MVEGGEDVSSSSLPILHVVVVGFHHKKGCQVEYAHPPLMPGEVTAYNLGFFCAVLYFTLVGLNC
jgi:hypothetical protein